MPSRVTLQEILPPFIGLAVGCISTRSSPFLSPVFPKTSQRKTKQKVLGPNLDPRFPDCLKDNQDEARRLLRLSYDRALVCFWDLASSAASGKGSSLTAVSSVGAESGGMSSTRSGKDTAVADRVTRAVSSVSTVSNR